MLDADVVVIAGEVVVAADIALPPWVSLHRSLNLSVRTDGRACSLGELVPDPNPSIAAADRQKEEIARRA